MSPAHLFIPKTSPTRYLSGIVALNILSDRGTGDWHQDIFARPTSTHHRSFGVEKGADVDPIGLLGTNGIYDASAILDAMHVPHPDGPVYAASHARAIADLVLGAVLRDESPDFVGLDDWMPRDEDKSEVLRLLDEAAQHLERQQVESIAAWAERNGEILRRPA